MWYTILILLALDIGGLLLVYVLLRDRVRRATTANAQISEIRDEMSRLVVDLNQTTDRNIALIEDRIASLNELLSAADKKIGLLHREIEKHDVGTQVYSRLVEGRPMRGPPSGQELPRAHAQAAGAGQGAQAPGVAAQEPRGGQEPQGAGGAALARGQEPQRGKGAAQLPPLSVELSDMSHRPGPAGTPGTQGGQEPQGAPDLQQRVLMLHRAGFAASLIASRVGAPLGEIELIISLEQRKGRA